MEKKIMGNKTTVAEMSNEELKNAISYNNKNGLGLSYENKMYRLELKFRYNNREN
jgi:hypothetical protein